MGRAGLESRGDFTASNKILIWSPALTLFWLVALLATHSMTPFSASLAYVPVGIAPLAWMAFRLRRTFRPSLQSFRQSAVQLFSYGIRSYGIDLCGTMSLYVDQALVVRLLAPDQMGTYVVALSLSRMLNLFHASVVMVLFPKAVSRLPGEVAAMTSRAMRMSTLLSALAGIGIAAFGPSALSLLYGKEFRGAGVVLRLLVLEVVLGGAASGTFPGVHGARTSGSDHGPASHGARSNNTPDVAAGPALWNCGSRRGHARIDGGEAGFCGRQFSSVSQDEGAAPPAPARRLTFCGPHDRGGAPAVSPLTAGRSRGHRLMSRSLNIFVPHCSDLLTDHLPHGDGLIAHGFLTSLAQRGHRLHVAAQRVELRQPLHPNITVHPIVLERSRGLRSRLEYMFRFAG